MRKTKVSPMPSTDQRAITLLHEKLESSGLTPQDGEALQLKVLSPLQTQQLSQSFKPITAMVIPYFDLRGQPLSARPRHPQFYRIRYLATQVDFDTLAGKKAQRYSQPPDSGVCAYFPPLGVGWPEVAADVSRPILITEGELKAAKGAREGFPTIGLGGVFNFRSSRDGVLFLPELEKIAWVKRKVYIVYDSDYKTNPLVCAALNDLAAELQERGAYPHVVSLPDLVSNGKTGLDDFLVHESPDSLVSLIESAAPLTLAKALWQLNDRVVYVRNPGLVIDRSTGQKMSPAAFRDHAFAALSHPERVVRANGTISLEKVSAARSWLEWPLRLEVERVTYRPGAERLILDEPRKSYNTWSGWGTEPKKGDVKPFLKLIDHLFTGAEPESKDWFIKWCAYPLQFPGTKLFTSAVLYGRRHGTGKSLIGYTLGRIYGANFTEISQVDLHSSFNEWAESKQFVLGDDVTGSNQRQDADLLKKLITQKSMRVNQKYIPSYEVPDCINYLFTSNHPDAFFLEDDDRRFFIHEVTVGPLSEMFYANYDLWLDGGGSGAVFHYLQHLELEDFNPAATALRTAAKERMISDVKSDLGAWVQRLIGDPDALLRLSDEMKLERDLFTNRELLMLYDPQGRTGTTANGLGRELSRAGIRQVLGGRPIKTSEGQDRYYAVRNRERWDRASSAEILKHLETVERTPSVKY